MELAWALKELRTLHRERYLAILFAPEEIRARITPLFLFEEELRSIPSKTKKPMLGLMRIAWWFDAIEALKQGDRSKRQPLLEALAPIASELTRLEPLRTAAERWVEEGVDDLAEASAVPLGDLLHLEHASQTEYLRFLGMVESALRKGAQDEAIGSLREAAKLKKYFTRELKFLRLLEVGLRHRLKGKNEKGVLLPLKYLGWFFAH